MKSWIYVAGFVAVVAFGSHYFLSIYIVGMAFLALVNVWNKHDPWSVYGYSFVLLWLLIVAWFIAAPNVVLSYVGVLGTVLLGAFFTAIMRWLNHWCAPHT